MSCQEVRQSAKWMASRTALAPRWVPSGRFLPPAPCVLAMGPRAGVGLPVSLVKNKGASAFPPRWLLGDQGPYWPQSAAQPKAFSSCGSPCSLLCPRPSTSYPPLSSFLLQQDPAAQDSLHPAVCPRPAFTQLHMRSLDQTLSWMGHRIPMEVLTGTAPAWCLGPETGWSPSEFWLSSPESHGPSPEMLSIQATHRGQPLWESLVGETPGCRLPVIWGLSWHLTWLFPARQTSTPCLFQSLCPTLSEQCPQTPGVQWGAATAWGPALAMSTAPCVPLMPLNSAAPGKGKARPSASARSRRTLPRSRTLAAKAQLPQGSAPTGPSSPDTLSRKPAAGHMRNLCPACHLPLVSPQRWCRAAPRASMETGCSKQRVPLSIPLPSHSDATVAHQHLRQPAGLSCSCASPRTPSVCAPQCPAPPTKGFIWKLPLLATSASNERG